MNIYHENGYIDMGKVMRLPYPFIFIIGARGIGKTYGALCAMMDERETMPFGLMRRTAAEVEILSSPEYNPFGQINIDKGTNYGVAPNAATKGRTSNIYNMVDVDGKMQPEGEPLAPIFALSTFGSMRGFGGGGLARIFYDEFIPEIHVRKIRDEGAALMNMYESVNRNRELTGGKPLQLVCASNSNRIDNDILLSFGLITPLMRSRVQGREVYTDKERGICVIDVRDSPISRQKSQTALYRATSSARNGFPEMALSNDFGEYSRSTYKQIVLKEYTPIINVGELTIYRHKSNGYLHVSSHRSGTPVSYGTSDKELNNFCRTFPTLRSPSTRKNITYDDLCCEIILDKYLNKC